jgi:predicted GNAT family acetyltransferase
VPVEIRRFDSVEAFLDTAGSFLEAREPEHMLTLGLVGGAHPPGARPAFGALLVALVGPRIVATAIWTPPWNVILSEIDDKAAIVAIASALAGDDLGGVHAPVELAEAFARSWTAHSGRSYRSGMRQRSYALEIVQHPTGVPGHLRRVTSGDRQIMTEWMAGFDREAMGGEVGPRDIDAFVEELIGSPDRVGYVWDDGGPVSMCQATGATPRGTRIGAVYTPPELRRRGYASALVAAASQAELDKGRRWCFLFTDLANPTSNRIYQAIGYRPIRDVQTFRFERLAEAN